MRVRFVMCACVALSGCFLDRGGIIDGVPFDAGPMRDGGMMDGGRADAGYDAGRDAGPPDAGPPDTGPEDAGSECDLTFSGLADLEAFTICSESPRRCSMLLDRNGALGTNALSCADSCESVGWECEQSQGAGTTGTCGSVVTDVAACESPYNRQVCVCVNP